MSSAEEPEPIVLSNMDTLLYVSFRHEDTSPCQGRLPWVSIAVAQRLRHDDDTPKLD